MATGNTGSSSEHYHFVLPGYDDDADVDELNNNFTTIDTELYAMSQDISTMSSKIGNVGNTSLQNQVNTASTTASNAKAKTDKLSVWDTSIDFVFSDTLTVRLGAATNRIYLQLCQNKAWTSQKNIASW